MKRKYISIFLLVVFVCAFLIAGLCFISKSIETAIGFFVLGVAFTIGVVYDNNKMIKSKNKVKEALALVDVQLKLRFDLVPNLIRVVKRYCEHEKTVFKEVARIRTLAKSAKDEKEKIEYANQLLEGVRNIIAVSEDYPNIKADKLFKKLMQDLVDVEDRLAAARRIYDSNVNQFNTLIQVFPRNVLAYLLEFSKEELFKIETGESININVEEVLNEFRGQ